MAKTVVILGGNFAGLHIAHFLLKLKEKDLKVILVTKNSHFYWNLASVRAIVPGIVPDDSIFVPLEKALSRYPKESYDLIIGTATASDFAAKTVTITKSSSGESQTLSYDHLVLTTGSRTASGEEVPWKANGTYEEVRDLLHATAEKVKAAEHIVVAGSGATGVESSGELGFEFGKTKKIELLSAEAQLLGGDSIAGNALSELKKLNVNVRFNSSVESATKRADGKTEIKIAGGETIVADLYLPTFGLIPNSEYIDPKLLKENKTVSVDEFYRVKGAEDVWAAGDIVSVPRAGFLYTQKQAAGVAKNLAAALRGQAPTVVKLLPFDIFVCATGRSRAVGRMGSFKMLSIMAWMGKGKTLAMQTVPSYIDGSVA